MTKDIAIRFDVSPSIGSGHLRRSIAFGNELERREANYKFVVKNSQVNFATSLGVSKSKIVNFDPKNGESDWLGKLPTLSHVVTDFCHHEHTNSTLTIREIKACTEAIVAVIDSIPPNHFTGDSTAYPEFVVTPYFDAQHLRTSPKCDKWISGVRYSILDESYFLAHRKMQLTKLEAGNYILVCCGGSDPSGFSEYILQLLLKSKSLEVETKIVVGHLFEQNRIKSLENLARQFVGKVSLIFNRNNISDLIANCGVVLGSVGLIRYEAACLGKPSFLVQNSSNYEDYLRNFDKKGLGNIFFLQRDDERIEFESLVERLNSIDHFQKVNKPNLVAFEKVDGYGIRNTLDEILNA